MTGLTISILFLATSSLSLGYIVARLSKDLSILDYRLDHLENIIRKNNLKG